MIVKCINNIGSRKTLVKGNLYTVKLKKKLHWAMTLVDMPGSYDITRFSKLDGKPIRQEDHIINYHYNLPKDNLQNIKYAKLKKSSQLKSLKQNTFYYIRGFSKDRVNRWCVNFENITYPYLATSFVFYTDDDYKAITRNKIIHIIKENIKQSD